jgi:splicing factor U2AF subunit
MFLDASGAGLDKAGLPAPTITAEAKAMLVRNSLSIAGFGVVAPSMAGGAFSGVDSSTRSGRRLYVGNLPPGITEPELLAFFADVMAKAYKPEPGIVIASTVKSDRGFGFIEFVTTDLATAGMTLDGVVCNGRPLKMQRPNDYNPDLLPPPGPPITLNLGALGIVSTQVPDGPNKVFVGGVPYHITEEQLKDLLQAFGKLHALHLVKDAGTSQSKGYGFCEYVDPSVTDQAVAGLNDLEIVPGRTLTVRRANPRGAPVPGSAPAPGMGGAHPGGMMHGGMPGGAHAGGFPTPAAMPSAAYGASSSAASAHQAAAAPATSVLRLTNMITPAELADPTELAEIEAEVKMACSQHGQIQSVVIGRQGPAAAVVFVKFAAVEQAVAAAGALGGKTFDSRTVGASFADEAQFAANILV